MKLIYKKNRLASAISCIYMSMVLSPAYASDIEIYTQANDNTIISPVVMMMFDTSGSMGTQDCKTYSGTTCVETYDTRINRLKTAMKAVLQGDASTTPTPGYVKMGLSRYQPDGDDGGWVVYPARPLDAFVAISPNGSLDYQVLAGNGDASGSSFTGTSLQVSNTVDGGVYFPNVMIPKGAQITKAKLILTANATATDTTTWQVAVESTGNAAPFSGTTLPGTRTYIPETLAQTIPAWTAGNTYEVDVKESIQRIASNTTGWCGGNALSLRLKDLDAKSRSAYAFEGDSSKAPKLYVEYRIDPDKTDSCILTTQTSSFVLGMTTTGTVTTAQAKLDDVSWPAAGAITNTGTSLPFNTIASSKKTNVGLRFGTTVPVLKGATILSANLTMTPNANYTGVQDTAIGIYNSMSMPVFCTSTTSCVNTTSGLPSILATKVWTPGSLTADVPVNADVASIVQSLTTSATSDLKFLGFNLQNNTTTTSSAAARSVESSLSAAPRLTVTWKKQINDLSYFTTVRDELLAVVNALDIPANTPLGAAYAEAARYMVGKAPTLYSDGNSPAPSAPDSRTLNSAGTTYVSPINAADQCSGNYIFLLTDGAPTADGGVVSGTNGVTGHTACTLPSGKTISGSDNNNNWRCMFDLADTLVNPTKNPKGVSIKTNSVFLGADAATSNDKDNMGKVASIGGGKFFAANDTADLVDALVSTVNDAIGNSGLIASPGVAVNQFNRLSSLNEVYYVLFDPTKNSKRWDGNLKRYKLDVANSNILDANNLPALSADGTFKKDSQSFWSTEADGSSSTSGGAASMLPAPAARKIYTYVDKSKKTLDLVDVANQAFVVNATSKLPTLAYPAQFNNMINWFKGYDIADVYGAEIKGTALTSTPARKKLGGGLHSRAEIVNYGYSGSSASASTDPASQKNVVFFSTLGSTLHGVDAKTGIEQFAFIPGEKISAIKTLYDNAASVEPEYGMDLSWTVYRSDYNGDGQINKNAGDKIYMYGGMRMGGSNYYGLDLTDLTSPRMLFTILGGSTGFENMGQTWSQPVVAKIKFGTLVKDVLIFGGGYDMCYEDASCGATQKGNQIYIVDALTGQKLWSASSSGATTNVSAMTFSMPSRPQVLDVTGDGLVDSIYIGDLGGQLFRVDIDNGKSTTNIAKRVKLVAQLGSNGVGTPTLQDARRIYEPPTVALFKDKYLNRIFATVGVGTGNRSRPLNTTTQDRYTVIFDYDLPRADLLAPVGGEAALQKTIKYSDMKLLDLSITSSSGVPTYTVDASSKPTAPNSFGWYVNLIDAGEKSLSTGIVFMSRLYFGTYSPKATSSGCSVVAGASRYYEMCMPYGTMSEPGVCDGITTRRRESSTLGLAPEPQFVSTVAEYTGSDGKKRYKTIKNLLGRGGTSGSGGSACTNYLNCPGSESDITLKPLQRWREKTRYPSK